MRLRTVSVLIFAVAVAGFTPLSAAPAIAVSHTAPQGDDNWAVAETANFRIFHNQSREFAEKAARLLEEARAVASKKWFGQPAPAWDPPCDVYLYDTAA